MFIPGKKKKHPAQEQVFVWGNLVLTWFRTGELIDHEALQILVPAENERRATKWEERWFFCRNLALCWVSMWSGGLILLVEKMVYPPFIASVSVSFEEMKAEPFVLLSSCLLLSSNHICPCTHSAILPEFVCCHLLATQNFERAGGRLTLSQLSKCSCLEDIFGISNAWLCYWSQ